MFEGRSKFSFIGPMSLTLFDVKITLRKNEREMHPFLESTHKVHKFNNAKYE